MEVRGELSCTSVADILGFISLRHLCREQVHWLLRASQKNSRGPQPQKNAAGKLQSCVFHPVVVLKDLYAGASSPGSEQGTLVLAVVFLT